ncbi:MAG: ABC transporter related protein [Candidatus Gottesmanbacteria bacterium GW2011_GWA2_44_17]|uniref:ABC transporter related protein n=1 Tax=Candidatus Gottesmanbacteria bacterium GW2011_GWA2_44_17 TaxID=1618444 RepID=A0A0G1HG04_9BACT|nr:MAG: ABC transporter related protein [Candidatus Gottesmanbacteria bacterium GW2011_GWA2_44_17]
MILRQTHLNMATIIQAKNLSKIYKTDVLETTALSDVSFEIKKGEFVAVMGPSGSGKSTLMHIIGALDTPTSGTYILDGEEVQKLIDDELSDIRNRKIGFIFQAFNLLPRTSALKNVMLPMIYAGIPKAERLERAKKYLEMVGLGDRMEHASNQLSGGQQQRVAIARALVMNPAILLADEPTGNIASAQAEEIMAIFQKINDEGHTIVMITHEAGIAEHAKRIIHIRDGKIIKDGNDHKQRKIRN